MFEFDPKEEIFNINCPNPNTKYVQRCRTCKYEFKKKTEQKCCLFCGLGACKTCSQKTRAFPMAEKGSKNDRGTICKLCDRKFIVRKTFDK